MKIVFADKLQIKEMKKLLFFTLLLLMYSSVISKSSKEPMKIGYKVCVLGDYGVKVFKVETIKAAQEIFNLYFYNNCISLEVEMKYSQYFEMASSNYYFSIKQKRINKRGNYKAIK